MGIMLAGGVSALSVNYNRIDLQNAQTKIISNYRDSLNNCNSFECTEFYRIKYSNQIKLQMREFYKNKRLIEW